MSERRDDTSEETNAPPVAGDKKSRRSYYYDDATNYEVYDPLNDEEEETEKPEDSKQFSVFSF